MNSRQQRRYCGLDDEGRGLLKSAMEELFAHWRVIRVGADSWKIRVCGELRAERFSFTLLASGAGIPLMAARRFWHNALCFSEKT